MKLPVGANYYLRRNATDEPGPLYVKYNGRSGWVTRVTPSGPNIPPQAHVVFSNELCDELWIPLKDLHR